MSRTPSPTETNILVRDVEDAIPYRKNILVRDVEDAIPYRKNILVRDVEDAVPYIFLFCVISYSACLTNNVYYIKI